MFQFIIKSLNEDSTDLVFVEPVVSALRSLLKRLWPIRFYAPLRPTCVCVHSKQQEQRSPVASNVSVFVCLQEQSPRVSSFNQRKNILFLSFSFRLPLV